MDIFLTAVLDTMTSAGDALVKIILISFLGMFVLGAIAALQVERYPEGKPRRRPQVVFLDDYRTHAPKDSRTYAKAGDQ